MSTPPEVPELQLDAPREEVLEQAARLIVAAWSSFDPARPRPAQGRRPGAGGCCARGCPTGPTPVADALAEAAQILDESIAQPRPRYFAFVGSSGLPIGVRGRRLASCFDINLAVYAGAASEIEEQAVRWVGELIGFPVGGGAFTSGGTISNLTALAAARERALPGAREHGLTGMRPAVYCSEEAHYSVMRAVELARHRRPQRSRDCRSTSTGGCVREPSPRRSTATAPTGITPVAVVATAGTTLTGAIDPIDELADVCSRRGVWLHVDGAYGVAAAAVPRMTRSFAGLDRADSVSLDAHKWLYLPKACGVIAVRRREDLHHSFAHDEGYLPHERDEPHAVDVTLEYSRPFRALKLWLAFRVHGAEAFRPCDRPQPAPGRPAVRRDRAACRSRAAGAAAALDRALPPRSRTASPTWTTTTPASAASCSATRASTWRRP